MRLISILTALLLTSCTLSVNVVHTQGSATDVIDTDQKAEPEVTTDLSVPAAAL